MEVPPPPPTTTAAQPSSSFEDAATIPTTASSVNSHEATQGTGSRSFTGIAAVDIRPSHDIRYDEQGVSPVRPPLVPMAGEPEPSTAWRGVIPTVEAGNSGSTGSVTDHHNDTGGLERRGSGSSPPLPYYEIDERGSSRSFGSRRHPGHRSRGSGGVNEDAGGNAGDDDREDLTPVTVFGETGGALTAADNDVTPLTSRPPRSSGHRGRSASSMSSEGGNRREGASGRDGERDGAGREITWQAFLTNCNMEDITRRTETASDSQSPLESRRGDRRGTVHKRSVGWDIRRQRYLRTMASTVGAHPWNNSANQGDSDYIDNGREADEEGQEDEDVDREREEDDLGSESVGTIETLAPRLSTASFPRMVETVRHTRPSHLDQITFGRSHSLSAVGMGVSELRQNIMQRGIIKFNVNPKEGIAFLVAEELVEDSPESICGFLSSEEGLSKRRLGEYFGRENRKAQDVLFLFLKNLEFEGKSLDEALRLMVLKFRLPGEAQQMDRIMEIFAERYHEDNPGVFSCSETAWVLSFGLMILNTDMYNRNIKESAKMTEAQFIKNHRGIDQGNDLPEDLLTGMYRRIRASEIRMDEGDMYESEVLTFVAPKRSGWLKKKNNRINWNCNRYWFVLNDYVLYYFKGPEKQDQSPRCIIPLEGIDIKPHGSLDLSISLKNNQGKVKSVKKTQNGAMQQFHHRSFELRAESEAERDAWVDALRSEVPVRGMDRTRSSSATPVTSSAATPIGTPSSIGKRAISKFGGSRRRGQQNEAKDKRRRPTIQGWAKTQNHRKLWVRRYVALFHGIGQEEGDMLNFYENANLCEKMIDQGVCTSYLSLALCDVTRLHLRHEDVDGVRRVIVLQMGVGKNAKEIAIAIEKQRDFPFWMNNIKHSCPGSVQSVSADGTPMPSSIGETAFPSVNTVDSGVDGVVSSVGDLEVDNGVYDSYSQDGMRVRDASGTLEGKHQDQDQEDSEDEDMAASGRTASTETQPDQDMSHQDMVLSVPSAGTAPNYLDEADVTAPTTPHVAGPDAAGGTVGAREHSSPATDVE